MATSASPLADTLARMRPYGAVARAEIGARSGGRWLSLDRVLREGGLDDLLNAASSDGTRPRAYVGAVVAEALVDAVISTALPALLLDRRLPDVAPANLIVHLADEHFWFERIALRSDRCFALPNDPAADHPSVTVVASPDELHRRFATTLTAAAAPWFDTVRARAPFGRRGMWGQLADDVAGTALWTARTVRLDAPSVWDEAHAIIDIVAETAPEIRVRPQMFPVQWSGGETAFQVKGTCCLWYTTCGPDQGDPADHYCSSCPLRDDDSRRHRLQTWLESEAAAV